MQVFSSSNSSLSKFGSQTLQKESRGNVQLNPNWIARNDLATNSSKFKFRIQNHVQRNFLFQFLLLVPQTNKFSLREITGSSRLTPFLDFQIRDIPIPECSVVIKLSNIRALKFLSSKHLSSKFLVLKYSQAIQSKQENASGVLATTGQNGKSMWSTRQLAFLRKLIIPQSYAQTYAQLPTRLAA